MHILTKFFVVIAAVLSVLLSGLAIAYTANADRLTQTVRDLQSTSQAAQAEQARVTADAEAEKGALQSQIDALRAETVVLRDDLRGREAEIDRLNDELKASRLASVDHAAQIDRSQKLIETGQRLTEALASENQALRGDQIQGNLRNIELADRINDLSSQLEVAQESNRTLQEQIVELRDELDRLAQFGASGGTTETGYRRAPANFRGRVVAVDTDPAGRTLVSINAGSNDQLRERMRFSLTRNNRFLGTIVLDRVDLNESVGVIEIRNTDGETIRPGDEVIPARG